MIGEVLLYTGAVVITIWGISHIIPTRNVVRGFGELSEDNRRIITMEWISEGLALCFLGMLVLLLLIVAGAQDPVSILVFRASALMLIIMAVLSLFTGARTSILPIKICPIVKTAVAVLYLLGIIV